VSIYRFRLVLGDSITGRYVRSQWAWKVIQSCLLVGACFDDPPITIEVTPVDYLARAVVSLSRQTHLVNQTFHIASPHAVKFEQVFTQLRALLPSIQFERMSLFSWLQRVIERGEKGRAHSDLSTDSRSRRS